MLLGLFYFAAVAGLAYTVSLLLQTALHRSPGQAALGISPMMVGIIIASFASRPAAAVLGRKLVFIGLALTLVGAVCMWTVVHVGGASISQWDLAPALLVLGGGMGACFGSLYDIAVGNITASEAGSASGSLSAVQQLANAIGSATVTTIYFSQIHHGGQAHAMTISLAVVALIAAVCVGPALLLPRATNPALEGEAWTARVFQPCLATESLVPGLRPKRGCRASRFRAAVQRPIPDVGPVMIHALPGDALWPVLCMSIPLRWWLRSGRGRQRGSSQYSPLVGPVTSTVPF
jgi:MFS family permease